MQQQFQGGLDSSRIPFISHPSRYSAAKKSRQEKEISPWSSNEQTKKVFNPSQYYETITYRSRYDRNQLKATKQRRNKSTPLSDNGGQLINTRYSNDFGPFLRTKKDGNLTYQSRNSEDNPYKLNLVTVNLDEEALPSPQKKNGKTLEIFNPNKPPKDDMQKEQPMRVRIFKKILQKNQQAEDQYTQRAAQFIQDLQTQQNNPFMSIDSNNIYQSMPKRAARISFQRAKLHSTLETTKNQFFPKISNQKQKNKALNSSLQKEQFFCKGQLITSKKETQSIRRMNYRSAQLSGQSKQQNILFLKKFSYQN